MTQEKLFKAGLWVASVLVLLITFTLADLRSFEEWHNDTRQEQKAQQ